MSALDILRVFLLGGLLITQPGAASPASDPGSPSPDSGAAHRRDSLRIAGELEELDEYTEMLGSPEPMVRLRAVKALAGSMRNFSDPGVALSLLAAARRDPDLHVAMQAGVALAKWGAAYPDSGYLGKDNSVARASDREARRLAQERQELEEYEAMLDSPEPMVRLRAVKALAAAIRHWSDSKAGLAVLEAARTDLDAHVAMQAAGAVERLAGGVRAVRE